MDWKKVGWGAVIVTLALIFFQGAESAAGTVSGAWDTLATFFNSL